jgi:hypothetical protein
MSRAIAKWTAAVVLVGAAADSARAQYPFGGGAYPGGFYINPITRSYGLSNYQFPVPGGVWYDPLYRSVYLPVVNLGTYSGVPLYGFAPVNGWYSQPGSGGYAGMYATYSTGYNPLVREQARALGGYKRFGAMGGYGGGNDVEARRAVAVRPANGARPADGKPAVAPELVNAPEERVLSGKALNDLAAAIRGLEEKGAKADSPLLPAGLLARVEYAGGPAADALMLFRDGKPEFPEPLREARFDQVRTDLERPIAGVVDPILAGKKVEAPAADKLTAAVRKAKADAASDAVVVTRFFDRLLSLAEVVKSPDGVNGLVVPKWSTIGASASELVSHLNRHKITFGPAEAGSREAYDAVYHGLAGYYTSLAQAGKK